MSWVTIIWSMVASACLTLAAIHFLIWCQRRAVWEDLLFTLTSAAVAFLAGCELWMMRAQTPAQFATALRWLHVPAWVIILSLVGFVRFHLRAGRPWLAWSICAVRTLSLLLNFLVGQNLNYLEVTALRHVSFLGDSIAIGVGVSNPLMLIGQLSLLLWTVFVTDAAITVWRRGDRRRALGTAGSIALFALLGVTQAVLVLWQIVDWPITASLFFLGIVAAVSYELSGETLRAAQLSDSLHESEMRMTLAASAADLSLWEWNIVRDEIWVTEKGRERAGVDPSERIDFALFLRSIHPDDRESTQRAVRHALEVGGEFAAEYRVMAPDGVARWVAARGHLERDAHGKPLLLRGVSVDITERKRSEESVRNAQEMMAAVFNSVPGLLYLYTEDGRLIQWNRQHEEMTGYTSEELRGFRAQDWFDEGNWAQASEVIATVFSEGYGQTEITLKRKNGEELPLFATGARVMIDGKPHMVGIAIDISLRKKAEGELAQKSKELFHLSRVTTLNLLSNSLAHELNQPLGAILRNAEAAEMFLQAPSPDLEEVLAILSDIRKDDQRAGEVIDRMRSQMKRREIERSLFDLNLLAGDVLEFVRPEADSRKILLALETGSSHPAVRGDRVLLMQVLLNLLLNAMDAVNDAAPDSRRVIVRVQTAGQQVEVAVSDTGHGIPEDKLAHIFDPFFTTKPDGLGMGLAISHDVIEAHGGRLCAKNNEAGGATFTITLPAAEGDDAK